MTGITFVGPRSNETADDHLIRIAHTAIKGSGDQKNSAHIELILNALREMDEPHKDQPYDPNGSRLVTLVYNFPDSVNRDLELHRYDNVPCARHSFCAMDKFGVLGKVDDSYAGFLIDCFIKGQGLTRTLAFLQGSSEDKIRNTATEIFSLKNCSGGSAYIEKTLSRKPIELGLGRVIADPFEPIVCEGELCFGGEGKLYVEVVRELMGNLANYSGFTPEKYLLAHRDFKINLSEGFGEDEVRAMLKDLKTRVTQTYAGKAA